MVEGEPGGGVPDQQQPLPGAQPQLAEQLEDAVGHLPVALPAGERVVDPAASLGVHDVDRCAGQLPEVDLAEAPVEAPRHR